MAEKKIYYDPGMLDMHFNEVRRGYEMLYQKNIADAQKANYYQGIAHGLKMAHEALVEHTRIEEEVRKIDPGLVQGQIYGMWPAEKIR